MSSIRVDFSGKVIAVTGAFGALGSAVAATLAGYGAQVARLDHAAVPPGSPSGSLSYGGLDLADDAAAASVIEKIAQETGRLNGLVNVAGGFRFEKLEQGVLETWDSQYRMNLRTAVACCRAALPHLLKSGQGRIVNIGALGAVKAGAGMGAYAASKAGVAKLTEALADELKDKGVTVNALLPSTLDTPRNRIDMPNADFSRWVAPGAIAEVIAFLISDSGGAVTGALIPVAGAGIAMSNLPSAGARLRAAVTDEKPLQMVGAITAFTARMAAACGFKALYLAGSGVAANSLGVPDLGISTMDDVLIDIRRITDACPLPMLVDADTGWGGAFNIARTVKSFTKFGAGGLHIEDQVQSKRCGHRPGKEIVSKQEMIDRIKAAVDARTDEKFVIMARTDALAVEGMDKALERAVACVEAGADMIFPEAITELAMYRRFKDAVKVPILANITEFGQTPLYTRDELATVGVGHRPALLFRLSAMNAAALNTYQAIRRDGTQKNVLGTMQTRADLYKYLDYYAYEAKLDELFAEGKEK